MPTRHGDRRPEVGNNDGAVYAFLDSTLVGATTLTASSADYAYTTGPDESLGTALACLDGTRLVAGAPTTDTLYAGSQEGRVYVFDAGGTWPASDDVSSIGATVIDGNGTEATRVASRTFRGLLSRRRPRDGSRTRG